MNRCSKEYLALVVTASSGFTHENPYGLFGTPYDYSEWRELAFRLVVKTKKHLDRLQAAGKDAEQTAESNLLVDEYNALVEASNALPGLFEGTWSGVVIEQSIDQAVALSVDAVCLMERVDKELIALGKTPPGESPTRKPKTPPLDLTGLGNTAVVVGLGYLVWRWVK